MGKKIDGLMKKVQENAERKREAEEMAVYNRMSLSQLKELANKNTPEERIREILASVDGLHLLGGG